MEPSQNPISTAHFIGRVEVDHLLGAVPDLFGNAFFGLGVALPPLLIGVLQADFGMSYEAVMLLIAAIVLVFTVFALLTTYPQVSTGFELSRAFGLLRNPVVLSRRWP